jgi:hypothetical protein
MYHMKLIIINLKRQHKNNAYWEHYLDPALGFKKVQCEETHAPLIGTIRAVLV